MKKLKIWNNVAYRLHPETKRFECQPILDGCIYFDMIRYKVDLENISQSDLTYLLAIQDFLSDKSF